MKHLIPLFLITLSLWGGVITPSKIIKTSSPVLDIIVKDKNVWAATANGEILQIGESKKIVSTLKLPDVENSWGEKAPQKAMSLDISPDGKNLIVAGEDGALYRSAGSKLIKTSFFTRTVIKKISYLSNERAMLALLSNEVVFFDLKTNKVLKTLTGGTSPLSDMAISRDKKLAVIGGEAGVVSLIDTATMKILRTIHGGNVDNIYKLDFQGNFIATAGQDRRAIIYTLDGKSFVRYEGSFLIYTVALSPSADRLVASMDEENTLSVYNTRTHKKLGVAKGHLATLNRVVFIDERHFVSSADENKILFWEIP